jgi:hypothetical protein
VDRRIPKLCVQPNPVRQVKTLSDKRSSTFCDDSQPGPHRGCVRDDVLSLKGLANVSDEYRVQAHSLAVPQLSNVITGLPSLGLELPPQLLTVLRNDPGVAVRRP